MPDGLDPDEIVARDKDEWKRLIGNARPIVEHVMISLADGRDLNDRKVVNEIANQVLPLINDLPASADREFFTQKLSRFLKVDERAFIGGRAQGPRVKRPRLVGQKQVQASSNVAVTVSSNQLVEAYIIGVLFRKPELLYRLDRSLQQNDLMALSAQDFEYTDYQVLFGLIREAVEQDKTEHHEFVVDALPESLQALSRELMVQADKLDPVDEKLLEELNRGLIKVRRLMANEKINQYRFLIEEAQQIGDSESVVKYQSEVSKLMQLLHALDLALKKISLKRFN
jgi:DNA primase